jgi:hypothetical protein
MEMTRDQRADYTALSYVWSGPQPVMTLTSNIAKQLIGTDIGDLPKGFRDVIEVTHALGLRFL